MEHLRFYCISLLLFSYGCLSKPQLNDRIGEYVVPAKEFSRSVREGTGEEFSIFEVAKRQKQGRAKLNNQMHAGSAEQQPATLHYVDGDPRYLEQGLTLKRSIAAPTAVQQEDAGKQIFAPAPVMYNPPQQQIPYGSSAPYLNGQVRTNPSLWPDEAQGASMFRDMRAFQAMDIITILINESSKGQKKAETDTESKFSLSAAISNLFGVETKDWAANNTALDPSNLINATTNSKFEGDGETTREGRLTGRISAVIMEALPNGLLRVEGTKIVAVNSEEEIMVISGLIRPRDIDARNQVDSSRIANMRIDFYGRGLIAENQEPGWLSRILRRVWPF
jgi:flagellar L-ring protein FlgH